MHMKFLWAVVFIVVVGAGAAGGGGELVIYLNPEGNDSWSGALDKANAANTDGPLASLAGVRARLRQIKAKRGSIKGAVHIILADGVYKIKRPIRFTSGDSGTKQYPVTIKAAPGATPVISGAREITGWEKTGKGLWVAHVPDVKTGKWRFRQLFINGKRYIPARHPNIDDLWFRFIKTHDGKEGSAIFKRGDLRPLKKGDEVEAVLFRVWDISRFPVKSISLKSRTLKLDVPKDGKEPSGKPIMSHWRSDRRYFLENSLSFLDSPGEWFLDRKTGKVYMKPLSEHADGNFAAIAPAVDKLMLLEGRQNKALEYMRFESLTFKYSSWSLEGEFYNGHQADVEVGAAIMGDFLRNVTFKRCKFTGLGRYAVWLRKGCVNNRVTECEFYDLGAGAVQVGENKRHSLKIDYETTHNEISNNHIHHCGVVWFGSVGIWVGPASYTRIAKNHIHDLPYSGLSVGWQWRALPSGAHHNIIENNYIHDILLAMSDGGGIYTLGLQPGTVIRNNVIHDSPGWQPLGWANGIYMDQGSSEMIIENNLVARVGRWAFVMGWPERNIVRNNIFALAGGQMMLVNVGKDNIIERNIFYIENEMLTRNFVPESVKMDRNIYFHSKGDEVLFKRKTFKEWKGTGQDKNSIIADPKFKNVQNGDFNLLPGSGALKVGFKGFKVPVVGPPRPLKRTYRMHPGKMVRKIPPRIIATPPTSRIILDGRLMEIAWKNVKPFALGETNHCKKINNPKDSAKVICDGKTLYVGLVCKFKNIARLRCKGSDWGKDDGAEVCFQWVCEDVWTPIIIVQGFASGERDVFVVRPPNNSLQRRLRKGVKFAAHVGKNEWSGEWKIPLALLKLDIKKERKLRFNIGVRRAAEKKWTAWLGTDGPNYEVSSAGLLVIEAQKKSGRKR